MSQRTLDTLQNITDALVYCLDRQTEKRQNSRKSRRLSYLHVEKCMARTRAEKRHSMEVVGRRKNVRGKNSLGINQTGMMSDILGNQSYLCQP